MEAEESYRQELQGREGELWTDRFTPHKSAPLSLSVPLCLPHFLCLYSPLSLSLSLLLQLYLWYRSRYFRKGIKTEGLSFLTDRKEVVGELFWLFIGQYKVFFELTIVISDDPWTFSLVN